MIDSLNNDWCAFVYPDGTYCPLVPSNHIKGRTTHEFVPLVLVHTTGHPPLRVVGRAIP